MRPGSAASARSRGLWHRDRGESPDLGVQTVLSPALGGIVIGQEVGRALGVRAIFAERQDGKLTLRRGFSLEPASASSWLRMSSRPGGRPARRLRWRGRPARRWSARRPSSTGAAASRDLDVPFHALATVSLPTYQPEECPLCAAGQPVVKPGSRVLRRVADAARLQLPTSRRPTPRNLNRLGVAEFGTWELTATS